MAFFRKNEKQSTSPRWLVVYVVMALLMLTTFGVLAWRDRQFGAATVFVGEGAPVQVELADTEPTRVRGLSGRDGLEPGHGMLFLFGGAASYGFWMKDMLFPIDIIWIRDGQVVDFVVDAPPPAAGQSPASFQPQSPADMVLEVPAGFCRERGLYLGMPVQVVPAD